MYVHIYLGHYIYLSMYHINKIYYAYGIDYIIYVYMSMQWSFSVRGRQCLFAGIQVWPTDTYHAGRRMQHLRPWESAAVAQTQRPAMQPEIQLPKRPITLLHMQESIFCDIVDLFSASILLFSDPEEVPDSSSWKRPFCGRLVDK